ncbi:MAG: CbiX/SirB N-terminal domain-containing protein, partial [Thermohalobaculum sp.]|nr:CbiX/SirB N-terminal domain-containing protein [Thermohalobaculum sp.]
RIDGPALCLPLFAGRAGHVEDDLPAALAEARFSGPTLAPIGTDPEIPALIAAALRARLARRAA